MISLGLKCLVQDMKNILCQLGIYCVKLLVIVKYLAEEGEEVSHLERFGLKREYFDDQAFEFEDSLFNLLITYVVVHSAFLILLSQED